MTAATPTGAQGCGLPGALRHRCGHDSRSVEGCLDCEAADKIESLVSVPAPTERDDFLAGICVGLTVLTGFDYSTAWGELVRTAGVERMLDYATFVEPDEWELAGFAKYARMELGRGRPRKRRASTPTTQEQKKP